MKKKLSFLVVILFIFNFSLSRAAETLRSRAHLHPLDTFTADTLGKGEWYYGQPPIPAPGYNFVGITDDITIQLDYTAWLGGVPSFNLRHRLFGGNDKTFSASAEYMLLYLREDLDEMNEDHDHLYIKREGGAGFARINFSYRVTGNIRLHASLGASYSERLIISNENRLEFVGETFVKHTDPSFMLGYEHFISDNLMFVSNISYGETWLLLENRPRKNQFVYGFRWLPFGNSPRPILRNMTVDLIALHAGFPDAEEELSFPIPLFPVVSWQW